MTNILVNELVAQNYKIFYLYIVNKITKLMVNILKKVLVIINSNNLKLIKKIMFIVNIHYILSIMKYQILYDIMLTIHTI